jgi:hypothetical protein
MNNPYLFDLAKPKPIVDKKSDSVRGAYIGISVSIGGVARHVPAATFGVKGEVFDQIPKLHKEVVLTSKR